MTKMLSGWLCALAVLAVANAGPAWSNSLNMTFYCLDDGNSVYFLRLGKGTQLEAQQKDTPTIHRGTYTKTPGAVGLSVPALGYSERSLRTVERDGFLLTFDMPSIRCTAIGHEKGPAVQGYAKCPTIRYIPSIGYEKNAFEFYPERGVKRRRWKELTAANDTLYAEFFGIYLIQGDRLVMAFGWGDDGEQILTGQIHADQSFTVDQLEPDKGACVPD